MKNLIYIGLFVVITSQLFAETKFAVVDMQALIKAYIKKPEIISMSKNIDAEKVALTKQLKLRQDQLRDLQKQYMVIQQQYEKKRLYMTEEEKKKTMDELSKQKIAYQNATNGIKSFDQVAKRKIIGLNNEIKSKMVKGIKVKIKALVAKEKYDFVFYAEALAHFNETTDITSIIEKEINAEVGVGPKETTPKKDDAPPLKQ